MSPSVGGSLSPLLFFGLSYGASLFLHFLLGVPSFGLRDVP